jgi:uncharacterized lipoprotein YmbA
MKHFPIIPLTLALAYTNTNCALTSKSVPAEIHYFTPEAIAPGGATIARYTQVRRPNAELPRLRLRLGGVTSSANLRTRIVFQHSPVELGSYDNNRWTENPEAYLRRALERALFTDGQIVQSLAAGTPVLDIDLIAFEEVRRGVTRAGRVELVYSLHDEQSVIAGGVLAFEHAARSAAMSDVVVAISAALQAASYELAHVNAKQLGVASLSK